MKRMKLRLASERLVDLSTNVGWPTGAAAPSKVFNCGGSR